MYYKNMNTIKVHGKDKTKINELSKECENISKSMPNAMQHMKKINSMNELQLATIGSDRQNFMSGLRNLLQDVNVCFELTRLSNQNIQQGQKIQSDIYEKNLHFGNKTRKY